MIANVIDAALFFAEKGVRVFPVKADDKKPAVTGWQTIATTDMDLIVRWWAGEYRGCNLGVVADNLIVLDVDTIKHGKGGKDGPATLAAYPFLVPATLTVRTASGGLHYYFRDSSKSGDTFTKGADKLGPGLDIQTGNAYLVGPFSTIAGNRYEVQDRSAIADLPDWIRERIRDTYIERPAPRPRKATEQVNNRYIRAAIAGELSRLDELQSAGWNGNPWDQTTFEVACNLIEISNGAPDIQAAAFNDFLAHAPRDPKFGPKQHEAKWTSALKKVGSNARVFPAVKPPRVDTRGPATDGVTVEPAGVAPPAGTMPPMPPLPPMPPMPAPDPPSNPEDYFGKYGLKAQVIAHDVKYDFALGPDSELWHYADGIYGPDTLELLRRVTKRLGNRYRPAHFSAISDFVRALPLPQITAEQPNPAYIVLENGVYAWRRGELLPHSPRFAAITKLPIVYDPDASCPQFDRWLAEVVPADTLEIIWQVTGYLLMFGNPLQRAILLQGPGGNGKSTYLRVLQHLLGKQNISALSLRQMNEDRFAVAGLLGKTANLAGDIDAKYLGDASRFKQIVGGDLIEVERKFGQPFSFEPYAVPVFSANEFWKTADTTHGYWRRWLPIPFPFPVEGTRPLDERELFAETPGIFNQAMSALRVLMDKGDFYFPYSVNELRDRMEDAADVLADWMDEDISINVNNPDDKNAQTPRTDAYEAFSDWCRHSGHKGMSSTNFYKRLGQLGYPETKIRGTRYVVGLDIARYAQPTL